MFSPITSVTELMRAPIMGIDEHSPVRALLTFTETNDVHYFAVTRQGKVVGQVCACDLRDVDPECAASAIMQPLIVTLSPETTLQESLAVLQPGMDWTIVKDSTHLVGVITWHDVRQALASSRGDFDEHQCSACAADHRLRHVSNGLILCFDCSDRAVADDWYDLGAAG